MDGMKLCAIKWLKIIIIDMVQQGVISRYFQAFGNHVIIFKLCVSNVYFRFHILRPY